MSESAAKTASATDGAPGLKEKIRSEGRHFAGEARSQASTIAGNQRDALSNYLAALANAAVVGGEDLDGAGYARSAATVVHTAGEVDDFARRLRDRQPSEIWKEVEDFAQAHPVLVFSASFALAFGVTRFLKSSAPGPERAFSEVQEASTSQIRRSDG